MTELLRNAWMGWQQFTAAGKLAALLLASLLFLWMSGRWKEEKRYRTLFSYTAIMTLCCILPVTAAGLMLYQTRFYDYEWVWSLVPITVMIAWAGTVLLSQCWMGFRQDQWRKGLPVTALLLMVLMLCSGLGNGDFDRTGERQRRLQARNIIAGVIESREEIYLWAPQEILEYTRELDASVRLIYGRNMWDASLGAYSYDTYSQEVQDLYLWMENVDEQGQAVVEDALRGELVLQGENCVASAVDAGVNCILLPARLKPQAAEKLAQAMGGSVLPLEGYYLLTR